MLKQFKEYLLDRDPLSTPTGKLRAFLFDEIESPVFNESIMSSSVPLDGDNGHPLGLGNSTILREIFRHLPTSDLIVLRRVDTTWNFIASEYLRQNLSYCKLRPSKLKGFLKMMRKSWCIPYGSYAIRIERLNDQLIKKFLCKFPPHIVRLRVKISSEEIPSFTKLLQNMSLLEDLHLLRIPEASQSSRLDYVSLSNSAWKIGIYSFPNLKSIRFESDNPSEPFLVNYDSCLVNVINSSVNLIQVKFINWDSPLAHLFRRNGLSNPKSFDGWKINSEINSNLVKDLIDLFYYKNMKFKALQFTVDESLPLKFVMEELVGKTRESLYHLSIRTGKEMSSNEVFKIPVQFPQLITLGLKGWVGIVDFPSLKQNLPSLTTLKLNPHCILMEEGPEEEASLFQFPIFESLEILNMMPYSSPNATDNLPQPASHNAFLQCICKMVPNLKELFLQIESNDDLHIVYERLPQLELLCVDLRGEGIDDEVFTGIPDHFVEVKELHDCGCPTISFPDDCRRDTQIECLKNLTTLIIRAGPQITNLSLLEGFSNCKKLETLWLLPLPYLESEPPTRWCIQAIADSFKNLKRLGTSGGIKYSQEEIQYLQSKSPRVKHDLTH